MAKKRRAGGGRKPKGDFSKLVAPLSIRMPAEMRKQLEAAAKTNGRSLSQELLRRLRDSFHRERDKARDPAMRALCFLMAETAQEAVGYHQLKPYPSRERVPMFDWRTNPFFFRAFKIAVGKLLDALEPIGKIEAPDVSVRLKLTAQQEEPGSLQRRWLKSYDNAETRGQVAAEHVWNTLQRLPQLSPEERERELQEDFGSDTVPPTSQELYGMIDAAHDLKIHRGIKL